VKNNRIDDLLRQPIAPSPALTGASLTDPLILTRQQLLQTRPMPSSPKPSMKMTSNEDSSSNKKLQEAGFVLSNQTRVPSKVKKAQISMCNFHSCKSTRRNFLLYLERHLMAANIPPRKEEGSYTYSLSVGGILCLLIGVRSLPLLRSKCKNPPPPTPHHPCIFRFNDSVRLVLYNGCSPWVGDVPKRKWGWSQLLPHPRLLILGMPLP